MDRFQEIENFLQYYAEVYSQNPDLEITKDTIYHALMIYGLRSDEIENPDISNYFDGWINSFRDAKNLSVYHDVRQNRFLQFRNDKGTYNSKYVKLYLNFSKEDIYDAANQIFKFIDKNNIRCASKTADRVRSDSLVLRIGSQEEAEQVIAFVNKNYSLSSKARFTNPFSYRIWNMAMAYDDALSYNTIVSEIISSYLNQYRTMGKLQDVSYDDFKTFVRGTYSNKFRTIEGIRKTTGTSEFQRHMMRFKNREELLLNLDQIYQVLIKSLDAHTTGKDMLGCITGFFDEDNNKEMLSYYQDVLNNPYANYSKSVSNTQGQENLAVVNKKDLFDRYIQHALGKYTSWEETYLRIADYMNGNRNIITRDNNFRQLFSSNINANDIVNITGNDVRGYVHLFATSVKSVTQTSKQDDLIVENKKELFDRYILHVLKKYGIEGTFLHVQSYMNGNVAAITRDNNFRQLFRTNINANDIVNITGNNIRGYINLYAGYINANGFDNNSRRMAVR